MSQAKLSFTIDGKRRDVLCDRDVVTIGRSKEMTVVIPDTIPGVSRHHATLRRNGALWILEDAGSRYGTFLQDSRITSAAVEDGDLIRLGAFELSFQVPNSRAAADAGSRSVAPDGRAARPEVTFGETEYSQVNASIDLASLERFQNSSRQGRSFVSLTLKGEPGLRSVAPKPIKELAAPEQAFGPEQMWVVALFSEVGRAMQTSGDLDEMLDKLLNMIVAQVPADFAIIGLIDPETNGVVPKAVRSAAAAPDDSIKVSSTIVRTAVSTLSAIVVDDTTTDARFKHAASLQFAAIRSVMCVPLYQEGRVHGIVYLDTRSGEQSFGQHQLEIVTALALFSAISIEQFGMRAKALEQQRQRERLTRYISPTVVGRIIDAGDEAHMLADKEEVTVLFGDLRGFTSLSEKLPPSDVVDFLNAVLSRLTEAVFRHQGTLDKFMGDGLMAFFGAPLRVADHARQAVLAAFDMLAAVDEFNQTRPAESGIGIRIGINTGPVVVGDIGSMTRKDYTVIGDTVNVASRFESSVAQVNQIVIGPATRAALGDEFRCEALPPVVLKGKSEPIQPYRVMGLPAGPAPATLGRMKAREP